MLKIDSHQHFWKYEPAKHGWIDDNMSAIRQDFLPQHLEPLLESTGVDGCVVVQVDQTFEENDFQLYNAQQYDFIKGVVGWVDLQAQDIEDQLERFCQYSKLKGFRHILQGEKDRSLMLKPRFLHGISKLSKFNFTYDILIYEDQLKHTVDFVSRFPAQRFVLDHLAKPDIRNGRIDEWLKGIQELSKFENVYCKVSGMVTEASWETWSEADFEPYLDVIFNSFGSGRLLFGSDWPVCLVAAEYVEVLGIVSNYVSKLSESEQQMFWGENATEFYNLR